MSALRTIRNAASAACYTAFIGGAAGLIIGIFLQCIIMAVTGKMSYKVVFFSALAGVGLGGLLGLVAAFLDGSTADVIVPRVEVERDPLQQMGAVAGAVAAGMLGSYQGYTKAPAELSLQLLGALAWGIAGAALGVTVGSALGVVFGSLWGTIREAVGLSDPVDAEGAPPAEPALPAESQAVSDGAGLAGLGAAVLVGGAVLGATADLAVLARTFRPPEDLLPVPNDSIILLILEVALAVLLGAGALAIGAWALRRAPESAGVKPLSTAAAALTGAAVLAAVAGVVLWAASVSRPRPALPTELLTIPPLHEPAAEKPAPAASKLGAQAALGTAYVLLVGAIAAFALALRKAAQHFQTPAAADRAKTLAQAGVLGGAVLAAIAVARTAALSGTIHFGLGLLGVGALIFLAILFLMTAADIRAAVAARASPDKGA